MGILLCRKKKKTDHKIDKLNQLILVKENINVFEIKRKLKDMKNEIRSIKIVQCISNRDRFESVDILLLREDLQISDFPRLQSVTIDFVRKKGIVEERESDDKVLKSNMLQSKSNKISTIPGLKMVKSQFEQKKIKFKEQPMQEYSVFTQHYGGDEQSNIIEEFSFVKLDDKLYEKALHTIQKDVKTHLLLRYTIHPEQIVINQMAFKDKRAFLYVMRKMKQLNCTIRRIVFKDIITLKKNIFLSICQQMREIQNLEEIQIINTNIMSLQVIQLQHLLCWMQKQIKVLVISGANLIDEHIDILFFQKFKVGDFYKLEKLELKNCPQLWKSDKYILLMKQYSQLKYHSQRKSVRNSIRNTSQHENDEKNKSSRVSGVLVNKNTLAITNGEQDKKAPHKQESIISINQLLQNRKNAFEATYIKNNDQNANNADLNKQESQQNQILKMEEDKQQLDPKEINVQLNNSHQNNSNFSQLPQIQYDDILGNYQMQQNRLSRASSQEQKDNHNLSNLDMQKQISNNKDRSPKNAQNKLETIAEDNKNFDLEDEDNKSESDQRLKLIQEDQRYDNRHERHFLIGQFLWESLQQQNIDDNDQETITMNNLSENLLTLSYNNTTMANDKGMSQQDNQFFTQFFKSCIRELMEIDMCKVIDFSGFCYQNFSIEQKKQICSYIVSSNTIQVFVIQYDRLFFKELCEQISAKYKTKRQELFDQYKNELIKILKSKNTEDFNHLIQNPSIYFNNNFKNNLFSLENIKIIASKFDQFQFDSFCFISFLSLFVLSIEIDFQNQQIEDQIVFPTHEQVLEYLRRMVTIKISADSDDSSQEEEDSEMQASLAQSDMYKSNIQQINEPNPETLEDEVLISNRNQNELENQNLNKSQFKISQSQSNIKGSQEKSQKQQKHFSQSSQIYEAIRNYQQLFDLSTSLQDLTLKNFSWQNAQSYNKDKSFSQFIFTFFSLTVDSIMNLDFSGAYMSHSCLNRLQEIIRKVFSKYKLYKEMDNLDTTSSCLNYKEAQEINKFLQSNNQSKLAKSSFRGSGLIDAKLQNLKDFKFIQTQRSLLNKSLRGSLIHNTQLNAKQEKGNLVEMRKTQLSRSSAVHQAAQPRNSVNQQQIEKSILEMNRNKTKSKYFLNKFRIKFAENKMLNIKQILNILGRVCKYVEVINATSFGQQEYLEMKMLQQQQQSLIEQNASTSLATTANKLQQSMMLAYQQGSIDQTNLLRKKQKLGINHNIGQSLMTNHQSHIMNSQSLGLIISKENDNMRRSLFMIKQKKEGFSEFVSENKGKNVLNSIKLVDYIGFSYQNIVEINNQIEDLSELILVRCGLQLFMLKQIMQKINRFKNLKKLVISGNNFSSENTVNVSQINQIYGKQFSDLHRSTAGTIEWKNESPLAVNLKKRYSFLPQNPILLQQKSLKNLAQSTLFAQGYGHELNANLVQSHTLNEVIDEQDVIKQNEDMFKYCIEKIFQIQNLKYIDLSNNEIDERFGKIILDELVSRTLKLLEYREQQQNKSHRNSLRSQNGSESKNQSPISQNGLSKFNTIQDQAQRGSQKFGSPAQEKKSGFYSKFIENQLNSNINQRNQAGGASKLSKLRHLNTRFFAENQDEEQHEEQDNEEKHKSENDDSQKSDSENEEDPSQNSFYSKKDLSSSKRSSNSNSKSSEQDEENKDHLDDNSSKNNNQDIQYKNQLLTIAENEGEENHEFQQIQKTEEGLFDIEFKNSEKMSSNYENISPQKEIDNAFPRLFNASSVSQHRPAPLITNNQQKVKKKINKMLENIPENELERVDSKQTQIMLNTQAGLSNYVKELQSKHKPSTFKANTNGKGGITTRIAKLKKEDLDTPEIIEMYLQNNNFKKKTIRNMLKQIGILFQKLKILDLSSKSQVSKKQKKQQQKKAAQQMQNKKNKFYINQQKDYKNDSDQTSNQQSNKSENESSEPTEQTFDQNIADQHTSNQSIYNNHTPNQSFQSHLEEELALQRRQQFEKTLSYPTPPEFQEIEKIHLKDISWEIIQSCPFIQNIFFYEKLQDVDLSGCIESDEVAELLVQSANNFMICPLKKLNLSRNRHLKRGSWRNLIISFLSKFETLEILNMSDCALNEDRIQGVLDAFSDLEREASLLELILARNIRLEGVLRQFIFILTQLHQVHLQVLDLSSCGLNDQSCENMIQGLLYGKKKRLQNINNYILNPDQKEKSNNKDNVWNPAQNGFKEIKKEFQTAIVHQEFSSKSYQQSFSLIKLVMYDNNISMKMNFLIQYCFVFQISEEDNILFSMQFSCNNEQKKQLNKIWGELKDKKGLVYSNLHNQLLEEYSVSTQTLVLGQHLFSSKKVAEDIILNCLRTFNSIKKLKLHLNERVVSILNCITNQGKSQMLDNYPINQDNLSASVVSDKLAFQGMNAQTTIQSQEMKSQQTKTQNGSRTQTIVSPAATNSSRGHIIVLRDKRGGAKKLTFIPKSRVDNRPVTCVQEKQKANNEMERQHTLPSHLATIQKETDKKDAMLDVELYKDHQRKISNNSNKNKEGSPLVINQFGMKNRLFELQNHLIQHKKNSIGTQIQLQKAKQAKQQILNKQRSRSGHNIDQNQMKTKKSSSPSTRNRTYSQQEPTPMSIFKKMKNKEENQNKSNDDISQHDIYQTFQEHLQTPKSKEELSFHRLIQMTPIGSAQNNPQSDQFLSVKKDTTSLYSDKNSFTHNQKIEEFQQNKETEKEVHTSFQTHEHRSETKTPSNFEMISPERRFINGLQNINNESHDIETEIDQEGGQIEIPVQKNINLLSDKNPKSNFLQFPNSQTNQKKKSIIKYGNSFLENLPGQEEKRKSVLINASIEQYPPILSNKSSILNKQGSQKKKITIVDEPQINNNSVQQTQIFQKQQTKSIIKTSKGQKLSNKIDVDALFNQDTHFGDIKKHSSFNLGELNEQQMQQLNEKINTAKYENNIIHLQNIETLVLQSEEKVGIVSLLEFFSLISKDLRTIDFTNIIMSHSMFVRVAFKAIEIFDNIVELRFANLQLQKGSMHQFHQTSQAIHNLFTNDKLEKLSLINSFITEELIESIIQPLDEQQQQSFYGNLLFIKFSLIYILIIILQNIYYKVKEFNLSKNKNISFSKEENLKILENAEVLNLSDCNLNEHKLNFNIKAWKSENLTNLLELDLSHNKGLGAKFFCHLGEYISQRQILQKLNISYTAMYEEKQRQLSYGLNYKNGISRIGLQQLIIKEMKFTKKEGTLMFFKALAELPCLEILDMSEMQISNYLELDILHNYLRYDYIGKFSRVKKMYLQNCTFLFDAIPYYNFDSKYSLLEYNHCSLFLLTQFDNIIYLDLTGCLSQKKTTKKFLQELDIMRRKKLLNHSIRSLNISKNLISSENIRVCVCNILFIFKSLQTLQMRSLVRYEQNYVYNILDALDSFQYFSFFQNQNYQNKKDAELQGQDLAEAFLKINSRSHPQLQQNLNFIEEPKGNINSPNNKNNLFKDGSYISRPQSQNSSSISQQPLTKQQEISTLNLTELIISDISNELINNKENIDMLLDICIANRNFSNLKKIQVNLEYSNTTNIIRLQNVYSDSLLEINEKYDMNTVCPDLNTSFQIRFKFKEANQIIVMKPEMKQIVTNTKEKERERDKEEKTLKKSIYFANQQQQSEVREKTERTQTQIHQSTPQLNVISSASQYQPQAMNKKLLSFSFTKMRVEYIDGVLEKEEQEQINTKQSQLLEQSNNNFGIKHSHFNVNGQNEHLFHTFSSENDEHQIELWRQFYPFLKKLNNPKLTNTSRIHISLDYLDPNLKILSSYYNIFIDNKFELNTNVNVLFNNVDSLYLGNMLYYFFVQVCSFKPQNDIIEFLINFLLFLSQNNFQDLTKKTIRLPPFLILSEEDASKIQAAFMNIQSLTTDQKKLQGMLVSMYRQKEKSIYQNVNFTPTRQPSMMSKKLSIKEDAAISIQRNKMISQVKTIIDKKREEYSSVVQQSSKTPIDSRKTNSLNSKKRNEQYKIVCNYFYKSKKGCEEYDEITKLKKMPPSTLNIDNFSINGLKAVYMICYHNDYFIKSDIDFESIMFVSTSLAFSLREYFYKNYQSQKRSYFKALLNKIMYIIMDIFVDVDSYFKYDESIQALDSNLETSKKSGRFFMFMIVSFYTIIYILTPVFFFVKHGPYDKDGLSYIMHATFIFYAMISVIFEIFYLRKVLGLTRHLIPDINLVHQTNAIARIKDYIYEKIMNIQIFSYKDFLFYQSIVFSFLAQLDAYQDICFVLVTFDKEEYFICLIATFVILYNKFIDILFFIKMTEKTSYSNLFFQNINRVYEYSQQTYLDGLSNILDVISPHNVIRITENFLTKMILPKKAIGLTINKQIFHRIRRVIGCDLPQIILQLLFTLRNLSKSSTTVQLSIGLNIITLIKSMYVLLTIKQSVLNQMDFDELSEQKAEFLQTQFLQYQQKEIEMFDRINSNVQMLGARNFNVQESKNISYDSELLKNEQKSPESYKPEKNQYNKNTINII